MKKLNKNLNVEKKNMKYTVDPCSTRPEDSITWKSQSTEFAVWIPLAGLVEESTPLWSDPDTGEVVLTVGKDVQPGSYKYAVYCKESNEFSEGSVHPVLIVEDDRD